MEGKVVARSLCCGNSNGVLVTLDLASYIRIGCPVLVDPGSAYRESAFDSLGCPIRMRFPVKIIAFTLFTSSNAAGSIKLWDDEFHNSLGATESSEKKARSDK